MLNLYEGVAEPMGGQRTTGERVGCFLSKKDNGSTTVDRELFKAISKSSVSVCKSQQN